MEYCKIFSETANSADPDQTFRSSLICVCTICICLFIRKFGVQNFNIFAYAFLSESLVYNILGQLPYTTYNFMKE